MSRQYQSDYARLAVAVLGEAESFLGSHGPVVAEYLSSSHRQCCGSVEDHALLRFLDADLELAVFDQFLSVGIDDDIGGLGQYIDRKGLLSVEDPVSDFVGASDRQMHLIVSGVGERGIHYRSYADSGIIAIGIPIVSVEILGRDGIIGRIDASSRIEGHRQRSGAALRRDLGIGDDGVFGIHFFDDIAERLVAVGHE